MTSAANLMPWPPHIARAAIARLAGRAVLTEADVADLRRGLFADRSIGRDEAQLLFALDSAPVRKCAAWTTFFVEAITDHIVWQARPTGIVTETQAEWLIEQVDAANTLNAFAVLINVLAETDRIPAWLVGAARSRAARGWPGMEDAAAAAMADLRSAA